MARGRRPLAGTAWNQRGSCRSNRGPAECAAHAEAAASHLKSTGLDCVIPHVLWDFTNDRVLTMDFEEGFRATDVERIDQAGICRREVAKLISSVFNSQIFEPAFVHCDPHGE